MKSNTIGQKKKSGIGPARPGPAQAGHQETTRTLWADGQTAGWLIGGAHEKQSAEAHQEKIIPYFCGEAQT